ILPLAIAMVKRPALYNGIRHFIFVIPPMAVLGGIAFAGILRRTKGRALKGAWIGLFAIGLLMPLSEMIRLHPYQYTYFNHTAGTVRRADNLFMLDYWGLAFKQASEGLRSYIAEHRMTPPQGRKWKVAVCGPQRPAQVALGPEFDIGWDSVAADFAMTLGEFYCKGLSAPTLVEIERDDVVYARVYDIRGQSIASLLATPAPWAPSGAPLLRQRGKDARPRADALVQTVEVVLLMRRMDIVVVQPEADQHAVEPERTL